MFIRKTKIAVALSLIFMAISAFSCATPLEDSGLGGKPSTEQTGGAQTEELGCINYIDVGDGECIFVRFPDGKDMLIDCGGKEYENKVKEVLDENCGEKVDYLVLTHPDSAHIGNAKTIINSYGIGKLFVPKILEENLASFLEYKSILDLVEQKKIEKTYSSYYDYIVGEGYAVAFLSPKYKMGSYDRFNASVAPTESQINDLSPIIYLDIYGVRTLLTGDAGELEEKTVLDLNSIGFYKEYFSTYNIDVKLENLDFLKVSDGGAQDCSTSEFLNLLRPKKAVFLVSGGSGKPTGSVLKRLQVANENYEILRTDVTGSITVKISENGQLILDKEL
jgi:competence protein ComEC